MSNQSLTYGERADFDRMAMFAVAEKYGWDDNKLGTAAVGWILGVGHGQAFIEFMNRMEELA